jgi:hypothetical protein
MPWTTNRKMDGKEAIMDGKFRVLALETGIGSPGIGRTL